jgi:hypothetical protein
MRASSGSTAHANRLNKMQKPLLNGLFRQQKEINRAVKNYPFINVSKTISMKTNV